MVAAAARLAAADRPLAGWLLGGLPAEAQRVAAGASEAVGLLGVEEGRAIVDVALEEAVPLEDAWDCSHVVHAIYASAGHAYPYASSTDIYFGNENFVRVRHPRAGDVIAWWGHVGIVVDPAQHSFYSLLRTGLQARNYESAYWRSRGVPRFYRLRVARSATPSGNRARTASARPILSEDR
jgi:NlpC/P60 family